jgi:hypothetical protein
MEGLMQIEVVQGKQADSIRGCEYPESDEVFARIIDGIASIMSRSIVPIFRTVGDTEREPWATGVLFRIADKRFVITAAHVLHDIGEACLFAQESSVAPRAIFLRHCTYSVESKFDVLAWRLDDDDVASLGDASFLNSYHFDCPIRRCEETFFAFGFPTRWVEPDPEPRKLNLTPLAYVTQPFQGRTTGFVGNPLFEDYSSDIHLLLNSSHTKSRGLQGNRFSLPEKFFGMSGCALWNVNPRGIDWAQWTPEHAKIAAIQTGALRQHNIIKGTRIGVIGALLSHRYPELRPALQVMVRR